MATSVLIDTRRAVVLLMTGLACAWTPRAPAQNAVQPPPGVVGSPPADASSPAPATSLSTDDLRFIDEAILTAAMGIETASMALEVSADPTLLAYAHGVVRDHRAIAAELARITHTKGVQPEQRLPEAPEVAKLRALKGADFDRMFVQMVAIDANRQAVALFQRQAEVGKDPALRAFAKRVLPTLEKHLEMGKSMAARTTAWRSGVATRQATERQSNDTGTR
ncbi:putative membrane protein [Cupriavidus gilardii J11]|uniref:Putative membrane protein n=1 Tax=Cupriavidus gilardii J11 TaxID=936133 RepID=A0A562B974_9BURK|nr:DUF4142 domain-containing protein [Cupriavidus gilardii]TWG81741.1 putative membrane protein [Cupriavidus gilardii J11]